MVTVTVSCDVIRQGDCEEDQNGACLANNTTEQTCRFEFDLAVVAAATCNWIYRHTECSVWNNGSVFGCDTQDVLAAGSNSVTDFLTDKTCGESDSFTVHTADAAKKLIGGVEIKCNGCNFPPG
jgi:hypothetical protein